MGSIVWVGARVFGFMERVRDEALQGLDTDSHPGVRSSPGSRFFDGGSFGHSLHGMTPAERRPCTGGEVATFLKLSFKIFNV